MHPSCHLYLVSYYCPINPCYENKLNYYIYLAVEDRESANPYVGHMMSAVVDPYYCKKESNSVVQPKEKDV